MPAFASFFLLMFRGIVDLLYIEKSIEMSNRNGSKI